MRVAFVNQPWDNILPSNDGPGGSIAILTYEFARRLVKHGHQVSLYGAGARLDFRKRVEQLEGINFRSMRAVRLEAKLLDIFLNAADRYLGKPTPERARFTSRRYLSYYGWQVARAVARDGADIIHVHNLFQLVPAIRALNPSAKIVLHMHCEWLSQLAPDIIQKYLNSVDLVIGASDHITSKVAERFPAFSNQCRTIYNGVDIDAFSLPATQADTDETQHLLTVGRISPEKGIHLLIEAFAKIHHAHPNAVLDIVGPYAPVAFQFLVGLSDDERVASLATYYEADKGSYLDQVQALIPAHLTDKVRFLGGVPYSEIAARYQQADIYVNASYSESFCMPVAEAMANELPVVAARAGGIQEIVVHGQTGFLFDIGDVDMLADGISCLLQEAALRRTMGTAGRKRVVDVFSYDRLVNRLETSYQALYH